MQHLYHILLEEKPLFEDGPVMCATEKSVSRIDDDPSGPLQPEGAKETE